ncbi:hypothetical protein SDC9_202244 [bioreactor metagenome]|uniref:Uncharacterized protein n=1 Tax=bioreactor metagenome TaxID=1076179 RepID=A0A645J530_9ZZZZ
MGVDAALHGLNAGIPQSDLLLVGGVDEVAYLRAHAGKRDAQLPQLILAPHGHGDAQLPLRHAAGSFGQKKDGLGDAPVHEPHDDDPHRHNGQHQQQQKLLKLGHLGIYGFLFHPHPCS